MPSRRREKATPAPTSSPGPDRRAQAGEILSGLFLTLAALFIQPRRSHPSYRMARCAARAPGSGCVAPADANGRQGKAA